jgi:hypothetical protein
MIESVSQLTVWAGSRARQNLDLWRAADDEGEALE